MNTCVKCGSDHTKTLHTDGRIEVRCNKPACGHVEIEHYGARWRRKERSELEVSAEEARG